MSKGLDWYPKGIKHGQPMRVHGKYSQGYPLGAVVHFTEGHFEKGVQNAHDCIDLGIHNGYTYVCIARTGELVQAHPISQWGYHAGQSAWSNNVKRPLSGSVSDDLIGIEMCNAGKLEKTNDGKYLTSWGKEIPADQVRYVEEKDYGCPTGYYHKYSPEQEQALIDFLIFLKTNDPVGCFSFDDVVGHHEVSGKEQIGFWRKTDPGGSLSMPMEKLRELLNSKGV